MDDRTQITDETTIVCGRWRVGMLVDHRLGRFRITAIDGHDLDPQLCVIDENGRGFKDYAFLFTPCEDA